mgnify:CR=1 FL=1
MQNLALKFIDDDPENVAERTKEAVVEVRLVESAEQDIYIFFRGNLFAQYQSGDNYSRNLIIAQLFLCHHVAQKTLSDVFHLTIPHLSYLINNYRRAGSAGIEDNTTVRIGNNQKIKGKVAAEIINQLDVEKGDRPTYDGVSKSIKRKWGIAISAHRIGCWWRHYKKENQQAKEQQQTNREPAQMPLIAGEEAEITQTAERREQEGGVLVEDQWQPNHVAGSFILYAMLEKSQFLNPFLKNLTCASQTGRKCIERVLLTLFFMHGLRLKSIEQTKHLLSAHFGPLVLGCFSRQQSLRYAIDDITARKQFDRVIKQHYQNIGEQTELGDGIYYTDGHFSCYYGKYRIPKGYDPHRQQPARGRNTIYLHNSLGHNILSFESPTNTTLNVDIETLLEKMEETYGDVKGKTLFFDRGGFSAKCFKTIKGKGMYFTTYLKHRKKGSEIEAGLFKEVEIELNGEKITNKIYEKEREYKKYGTLRTIIFIGKQGKQIPVITTNQSLSGAEIIARLQKRWVEENGFKYMDEHYNIDLLTTYQTEPAPDKIMARQNPQRKEINGKITSKKAELRELKEQYTSRLREVKDKDEVTITEFEQQEEKLNVAIKTCEFEIGFLQLEREKIPSKVTTNLKDESVISCQKRRMFINLVKTMNYNCEKWLQLLFCQHHPKADETLSLIRHVLTQPGRIRQRGLTLEVELERLDSEVQAKSLNKVLDNLKENNYLKLPDGRELAIWQAS